MVKVSDIPVMSNQQSAGNGLGSTVPSLQNALFMAPQAGDTWTKRADMTTERYSLGVSTVNGKIYAVGGAINWGNTVYKILEEYDPETDTWRKRSDMPTARHYLASTALNGKLYAIGGVGALSKVEEYDTIKDNWISKSDMMTPRLALAACEANGRIYSIGGTPDWVSFVSTVEEYDPKADKWIKKANMPTMRGGLAACTVNGKIYAIGGSDEMKDGVFSANALSAVEEYDPKTDKWTRKADMPTTRSGLCAVAVNGKIYAIGGSRQLNGQLNIISTLEEYDPDTDKWTKKADMPGVRNVFGADSVNGKIYAIGGFDGGTWLSRVEEYDTGFTGESINPEGKLPTTWGEVRTVINR